jgi:hypothetical protein
MTNPFLMLKRPFAVLAGACAALALLAAPALADVTPPPPATASQSDTFEKNEIVTAVADFFGVTAEAAGAAVERIFSENGRPNAYIKGNEAAAAFGVGLRYGKGSLRMKGGAERTIYWQGPSIGWDVGANGAKCFTLVYNLPDTEAIFRRFPGVEGSAYFIGGIGINYQRAEDITLAPMRAGVGFRLGANVGYLAYSKRRHILPF